MKNKKGRFLVFGGTGFIGNNLVKYLKGLGNDVVIFHRKESDLSNLRGISYTSVTGDLTDKKNLADILSEAMEGCNGVFNLAACSISSNKNHYLQRIINVDAARTIAKVVRDIGGIRLVHISSSIAVGFPENNEIADESFNFNVHFDHYGLTKHLGEKAVLEEVSRGLDAVVAIPCSTVGPRGIKSEQLNVFKSIKRGKMHIYPAGGICLTGINDLIRGLVLSYENGNKGSRYILGGHNITYKQYFHEIASATGGKPPWIRLPKTIMPWLGFGVETGSRLLGRETNISRNVAMMISRNLYYSSELAIKELGYRISGWRGMIKKTAAHLVLH